MSCVADPAVTCRTLFGHSHRGSSPRSPARIDAFVSATSGRLGSADEVQWLRTPLGLHLLFRGPEAARHLSDAVCHDRYSWSGSELAKLRVRFSTRLPLMACVRCGVEDTRRFNTPYWRTHHQLAATWRCQDHACRLVCFPDLAASRSAHWRLPPLPSEVQQQSETTDPEVVQVAHSLSLFARRLCADQEGSAFFYSNLSGIYALGLARRNLADRRGFLRSSTASARLHTFLDLLQADLPKDYPSDSLQRAHARVLRLVMSPNSFTDPTPHILALTWLFEDWACLVDALEHLRSRAAAMTTTERVGPGFNQLANPVTTSSEFPSALNTGIVSTVENRLQLRSARRRERFEFLRSKARDKWMATVEQGLPVDAHPRVLDECTYRWLFTNDRAWLRSSIRGVASATTAGAESEPSAREARDSTAVSGDVRTHRASRLPT